MSLGEKVDGSLITRTTNGVLVYALVVDSVKSSAFGNEDHKDFVL